MDVDDDLGVEADPGDIGIGETVVQGEVVVAPDDQLVDVRHQDQLGLGEEAAALVLQPPRFRPAVL